MIDPTTVVTLAPSSADGRQLTGVDVALSGGSHLPFETSLALKVTLAKPLAEMGPVAILERADADHAVAFLRRGV
jgi:hypothetical protein